MYFPDVFDFPGNGNTFCLLPGKSREPGKFYKLKQSYINFYFYCLALLIFKYFVVKKKQFKLNFKCKYTLNVYVICNKFLLIIFIALIWMPRDFNVYWRQIFNLYYSTDCGRDQSGPQTMHVGLRTKIMHLFCFTEVEYKTKIPNNCVIFFLTPSYTYVTENCNLA